MRIILPNGLTLDGTMEQITAAAKALGYHSIVDNTVYHYSDTKREWVKIAEMDTKYLRNALLKILREHTHETTIDNSHFVALLAEYNERGDK